LKKKRKKERTGTKKNKGSVSFRGLGPEKGAKKKSAQTKEKKKETRAGNVHSFKETSRSGEMELKMQGESRNERNKERENDTTSERLGEVEPNRVTLKNTTNQTGTRKE